MEAVRRRNGTPAPVQGSLFESPEENSPLREAIDFYQHAHAWSKFEPFVKTSWPRIILVALNVPSSSR
jgi:hypothetical protein